MVKRQIEKKERQIPILTFNARPIQTMLVIHNVEKGVLRFRSA